MCSSGKISYTSRKMARHGRRELELIYSKKYEVYKSLECGLFHLSTKHHYGKQNKKGEVILRNVLSINRFCDVSYRIARLTEKRRRELSGAEKGGKSNKRRGCSFRDQ